MESTVTNEVIFGEGTLPSNASMLELAGERIVSFKDRGQAITFTFRRLSAQDWQQFFNGVVFETERIGSTQTRRIDHRTSGIALVDATITRADGYKLREGQSFMALKNWKQRIPAGHKIAAAELLQKVGESTADRDGYFDPEADEVYLDAAWGSSTPGKMMQFSGLVHRFTPPTAEHQRKYNRASSEARVVGGSRAGKTIYPGRQELLIAIYDQLVLAVEGYGVNGQPLEGAENIRREMDAYHKVTAVQRLFAVPDVDEDDSASSGR